MDIIASPVAPLLAVDSETAIDGEYIVVFKEEVGEDEGELNVNWQCSGSQV